MRGAAQPRILTRSDLPRALVLWRQLLDAGFEADPRFAAVADPVRAIASYADDVWLRQTPFPHGWVVEDPVGLAGLLVIVHQPALPVLVDKPSALITDLFVAPRARRRGTGRRLVSAACDAAARAGHGNIEVGTLSADTRAVAFWQAVGFARFRVTLQRHHQPPTVTPPPTSS